MDNQSIITQTLLQNCLYSSKVKFKFANSNTPREPSVVEVIVLRDAETSKVLGMTSVASAQHVSTTQDFRRLLQQNIMDSSDHALIIELPSLDALKRLMYQELDEEFRITSHAERSITTNKPVDLQQQQQSPPKHHKKLLIIGAVLSATSGLVNGGMVSSLVDPITVSHVTGIVSNTAAWIGQGLEFVIIIEGLGVFVSFMLGSFVSGLIIHPSWTHTQIGLNFRGTRYHWILVLQVIMLSVSYVTYSSVAAEVRKEDAKLDLRQLMSALSGFMSASFACGLQNAAITSYSKGYMRTTHVTGTTTDIGMYIGQSLSQYFNFRFFKKPKTFVPMWKLWMLCTLLTCFFFGALLGSLTYGYLGPKMFFIPIALCSLQFFIMIVFLMRRPRPKDTTINLGELKVPRSDIHPISASP